MSTSTIPAAIDALLALVRATADSNVHVVDGFPRFRLTDVDLIAVGGKPEPTASGEQSAAGIGSGRRAENYTLRVTCSSSRGVGQSQKLVRDRAFALMGYVETGLRRDHSLGGIVLQAEIAGGVELNQSHPETFGDDVVAEVLFDVAVQARI